MAIVLRCTAYVLKSILQIKVCIYTVVLYQQNAACIYIQDQSTGGYVCSLIRSWMYFIGYIATLVQYFHDQLVKLFDVFFLLPILAANAYKLSVAMHGMSCIPVTFCEKDTITSTIFLSNTREHLTWQTLANRSNVTRTYNDSTNMFSFCFNDINESFVLFEYCTWNRACDDVSTFCCKTWNEFVSRTNVDVAGGSSKLKPTYINFNCTLYTLFFVKFVSVHHVSNIQCLTDNKQMPMVMCTACDVTNFYLLYCVWTIVIIIFLLLIDDECSDFLLAAVQLGKLLPQDCV